MSAQFFVTLPVVYSLDRDEDGIRVYVTQGLVGFYLWSVDEVCLVKTIVPLTQHLFKKNRRVVVEPAFGNPCFAALLRQGVQTIEFKACAQFQAEELLVPGQWYENPDGIFFYMPLDREDMTDRKILDRIKNEMGTHSH